MAAPEWPPRVRDVLTELQIGDLYRWWQSFSRYINNMQNDVTAKVEFVLKTTTGDPADPFVGLLCINTADKTIKIYTGDEWVSLVGGWMTKEWEI